MGIKYLNKFLRTRCKSKSIFRASLQQVSGKTVVVDTYIYLYKYLSEDRLIDNFHRMVTVFKKYHITPIFIFDGKPPAEKRDLLLQRKEKKKEAESKYKEIIDKLERGLDQTDQIETQLAVLKKQFLKVDQKHVQLVKRILSEYQIKYVDASGESDQLCVEYVVQGKAWGCVTDDMDMFVYGVPFVLRELNLEDETVSMYILHHILQDLNLTMYEFRQILVLSGTDYNIYDNVSLYETIKWFQEYRRFLQKHGKYVVGADTDTDASEWVSKVGSRNSIDFYDWLCRYTKYIKDYSKLKAIHDMFLPVRT